MKITLRHIYLCRTANMSWRTCVVVKQIQSNPKSCHVCDPWPQPMLYPRPTFLCSSAVTCRSRMSNRCCKHCAESTISPFISIQSLNYQWSNISDKKWTSRLPVHVLFVNDATRQSVTCWAGDDMTQTSVVDSIYPAKCCVLPLRRLAEKGSPHSRKIFSVLPLRRLAEKGSPHSRKIFSKCKENTQYNLFSRFVGI